MKIKNYNSTHLLSAYDLGDVCTVYINTCNSHHLTSANDQTIKKYSPKLNKIISDDSFLQDDGKYLTLTRIIGVIVEKHESIDSSDVDKITVMFKTDDNRYLLNTYAINTHDVFTNNKTTIPPCAVFRTA